MPLLTLADAELAYGDLPLLDRASFALEERERIGLIGRNGTGKSSLLRAIVGSAVLDGGELKMKDGLRVVLVEQEPVLQAFAGEAHKLEKFLHLLGVEMKSEMSGGERKRAALAHAFALELRLAARIGIDFEGARAQEFDRRIAKHQQVEPDVCVEDELQAPKITRPCPSSPSPTPSLPMATCRSSTAPRSRWRSASGSG